MNRLYRYGVDLCRHDEVVLGKVVNGVSCETHTYITVVVQMKIRMMTFFFGNHRHLVDKRHRQEEILESEIPFILGVDVSRSISQLESPLNIPKAVPDLVAVFCGYKDHTFCRSVCSCPSYVPPVIG